MDSVVLRGASVISLVNPHFDTLSLCNLSKDLLLVLQYLLKMEGNFGLFGI